MLFNHILILSVIKFMNEDELSYKTLRKIQQMEKNSPSLTSLYHGFYSALSEYLEKLDKRLKNESSSQKKMILSDEIQNTKKIVINIYEQREKKILLAAVSKARGGNPDLKNLENMERSLFDSVLNLMLNSREKLLEKSTEKKTDREENKTVESSVKKEEPAEQSNSNSIMRITDNIPEFIGTDKRKYNLRAGDLVSLPEDMGKMLSKRGVAEEVNP